MMKYEVRFKTPGGCDAVYGRETMEQVETTVRGLRASRIACVAVELESGNVVAKAEKVRGLWKVNIEGRVDKPPKTGWPFHGSPA